jgi:hypothetical protein
VNKRAERITRAKGGAWLAGHYFLGVMRKFYLAFILLGCAGCSLSYLATNRAPYAGYVGQDLTLKRATLLWKTRLVSRLEMTDTNKQTVKDMSLGGDSRCVAILPPGTIVRLFEIRHDWNSEAGGSSLIACGKTTLIDTGQEVTFQYFWGDGGKTDETINRAPWDDDNVPSKRHAAINSKSFTSQ